MNANGSGGLLQEFRKKTLFKMVRYGSATSLATSPTSASTGVTSSSSPTWEDIEKQEIQDARTRYFLVLMKRFQEQDCSLRQLEAELGDMLVQLQHACGAMTRAVEVFAQTFRYDAASYKLGVDYLAAVKMIGRDGAHMMDQSIRFTVLDPILSRLERHNRIKTSIQAWEKLYSETADLELSLEQARGPPRSEKDDRRRKGELRLAELQAQLAQIQDEVTPRLEETTDTYPAQSQVQLFGAMRLQLAMFFYQANQSLFGGLSETESEIVRGVGHTAPPSSASDLMKPSPTRALANQLSVVSSISSENSTELETDESYPLASTSEEDGEVNDIQRASTSSITLEEFELGKCPPEELPESEYQGRRFLSHSADTASHLKDVVNLFELASNPVLPDYSTDSHDHLDPLEADTPSDSIDTNSQQFSSDPHGTRSRSDSGVLSTFRRSLQSKFGAAKSDRSSRSSSNASLPEEPIHAVAVSTEKQNLSPSAPPLSPFEWRRIEGCLWEIDRNSAPSPAKPPSTTLESAAMPPSVVGAGILQRMVHQDKQLFYRCASYLRIEEIALLSKTTRMLHATLLHCPSVWKRSIRSCGLSPPIRSAVWLSMLYGTTPWHSDTTSPHHLSASENRTKIYKQLLVKAGTRMANVKTSSLSEEDEQLLVWLQEIDVDVARTCNKDIYAKDVADDWSADPFCVQGDADRFTERSSTESEHSVIEALAESALLTPSLSDNERESPCSPTTTAPQLDGVRKQQSLDKSRVEAKIRRILRAYVMYNPRVGYCQGMNFLVRVLIEVAEDEADVFWLFVGLSEPEINRNLYEPGLAVLQPLLSKFELLVSYHMPELYVHFQREGVHVAAFSTRWFLTMFSSFETFGPTLVLRVLDMFVIDGWRILLSMGLVVLDELREVLLRAELEDMLRILQSPRNHMAEPDHARRRQLLRHALAFCTTRAVNTL